MSRRIGFGLIVLAVAVMLPSGATADPGVGTRASPAVAAASAAAITNPSPTGSADLQDLEAFRAELAVFLSDIYARSADGSGADLALLMSSDELLGAVSVMPAKDLAVLRDAFPIIRSWGVIRTEVLPDSEPSQARPFGPPSFTQGEREEPSACGWAWWWGQWPCASPSARRWAWWWGRWRWEWPSQGARSGRPSQFR